MLVCLLCLVCCHAYTKTNVNSLTTSLAVKTVERVCSASQFVTGITQPIYSYTNKFAKAFCCTYSIYSFNKKV